ncbi:hypothetical protein FE904_06940 [Chryseobacterium indologenes]|uniref:hypothetical protein n=1 Tax=Chryseobacterium indologenes TaxID=253 RepID=UPI001108CD5B|nr:hypothetical protein [Chryseobacterium indologenes]TLX26582.1 hypothetical protein FE904_06940 [Chryseobacterium indologenes]
MIKNLPTSSDYKNVAFECLIQAYKSICKIDNEELEEGVDRSDIWNYNEIVLKTSVVLTHQALEALLKAKISEKTPLLLLEQKREFWKTLPDNEDSDFADLYTISGQDLLRTFFATVNIQEYTTELVNHFEEVRKIRNKLVHGISANKLSPEQVHKLILNTFSLLCGKDSFWTTLQDKFYNHPAHLEGEPKFVFDKFDQYVHLEYLEAILGKGELNKHFSIDFKARRYLCPDCTGEAGVLVNDGNVIKYPNFKYTFLKPNEPTSTNVHCIVCNQDFEVERIDCNKEECKGNVIFVDRDDEDIDDETGEIFSEATKICLTCDEIQ